VALSIGIGKAAYLKNIISLDEEKSIKNGEKLSLKGTITHADYVDKEAAN
jgi:hypothetical protein